MRARHFAAQPAHIDPEVRTFTEHQIVSVDTRGSRVSLLGFCAQPGRLRSKSLRLGGLSSRFQTPPEQNDPQHDDKANESGGNGAHVLTMLANASTLMRKMG